MRLDELLTAAGLPPSTAAVPLGGGTFNTVLRVTTAAGDVVVKLAPDPAVPVLSYENGIMGAEALYYELAASHGVDSVPRVLHHTPAGLVMSLLEGQPWPTVEGQLTEQQSYGLRFAVGRELAALHRIRGEAIGYPARPLHSTWRSAYHDMLGALVADATHFGVTLPHPADRIVSAVERVSWALDRVSTPVLVHFDLWDGNILVSDGSTLGGLIDAERCFWGDPLAELASLRLFGELQPDAGLLAGYRAGGSEWLLDDAGRLRLLLYRLYLYLIMWVETVPRGSDEEHVAWRRGAVHDPAAAIVETLERA